MTRKHWHLYIARLARGKLIIEFTNDPQEIPSKVLYIEECRDRSSAKRRLEKIERISKREKISLCKAAENTRAEKEGLPGKMFQVVNEAFICENCKAKVKPTVHDTPRDHCPFCLYSKHIDLWPGDRKNKCLGLLKPIGATISGKKGIIIHYICKKCGEKVRSKAALKSSIQPDNQDLLIELSKSYIT